MVKRTTFESIPYVIVNRTIVIDRRQHTGELAGQVL